MTTRRRHSTRATRDTQISTDVEFDDSFLFEDPGTLPNIPPRAGYVQYWARVNRGNAADARNALTKKRRGWRPRPADTIPAAFQDLLIDNDTGSGLISTHDLVLMERPQQLQDKVNQHKRNVIDERERAVKQNVFREHQNIGGAATGLTAPEVEDRAKVERGANVLLDD